MRYCVTSKTVDVTRAEAKCRGVGATNVKVMRLLGQVNCDLSQEQASKLLSMGFLVKVVKAVKATTIHLPETAIVAVGLSPGAVFQSLRDYYRPSLSGTGLTAVVLDSGIRATHEALGDRVVLEANFTTYAPGDKFDHGTNCASIIVGISPRAHLMDIKVIGDNGLGSEENAIEGIEAVCELVKMPKTKVFISLTPCIRM